MAFTVACSTLLMALVLPQGGQDPLLSSSEQKSLRDKLGKLIETRLEYDVAQGRGRDRAQNNYEKAKEIWQKEWDRRCEAKGDLMKSMPDMLSIFEGTFSYERKSGSGELKNESPNGLPPFSLLVPRAYKQDKPIRTIVLVTGVDDKGADWASPRNYLAATWKDSPVEKDTLFHVPLVSKDLLHDLDRHPDYAKTGEDIKESERILAILASLGETKRNYFIDRRRMFLDCGRETSAFGLRLCSHFPDTFAGVILRWPVEMKETRVGSLVGVPVLLVSSADTKDACAALKQRLDFLQEGQCTVVDATDAYPFKAAAGEIEKWMAAVERQVMRTKVVLEPNDDRFRRGYWAEIGRMDQIHAMPADKKPRLEVTADRATNRIDVKAVGVETFNLQLNDQLVDLDKPFTVVINGKAVTEQRTRDFGSMIELILLKFDTDYLFPVSLDCTVPKQEKPAGDGGGK